MCTDREGRIPMRVNIENASGLRKQIAALNEQDRETLVKRLRLIAWRGGRRVPEWRHPPISGSLR